MPFTNSSVVPYGLLVMHAMDIFRLRTCPPAPFSEPSPPTGGGEIIGYILGSDSIVPGHPHLGPGPLGELDQPVCYGTVVRRSPAEVVVALRGTDGFAEWLEDGQFPLIRYVPKIPLPPGTPDAQVELGFWGIYRTLALTDTGGAPLGAVADALPAILGPADAVVVSGHSLGAPLATYLTLDLARGHLGQRVSGCYFASPHPGDQALIRHSQRCSTGSLQTILCTTICSIWFLACRRPRLATVPCRSGRSSNRRPHRLTSALISAATITSSATWRCSTSRRRCTRSRRCRRARKAAPGASADRRAAGQAWRSRW